MSLVQQSLQPGRGKSAAPFKLIVRRPSTPLLDMTLEILEARVNAAVSAASTHADSCKALVESGDLKEAIEYCTRERIEPPQCSLTAQSENASRLREVAARKLSDSKWWKKSLETNAIRSYEAEQMAIGNVRNYVSDGLAAYTQKNRAKR